MSLIFFIFFICSILLGTINYSITAVLSTVGIWFTYETVLFPRGFLSWFSTSFHFLTWYSFLRIGIRKLAFPWCRNLSRSWRLLLLKCTWRRNTWRVCFIFMWTIWSPVIWWSAIITLSKWRLLLFSSHCRLTSWFLCFWTITNPVRRVLTEVTLSKWRLQLTLLF